MIRINLLPYREERKKENILRQINVFLFAFFVVFAILIVINVRLSHKVTALNTKIKNTKTLLAQAETKSKKVDQIKQALEKLNQKTEVIRNIEKNRRASVLLLENMSKMVAEKTSGSPSGASASSENKPVKRLWFTNFEAKGDNIRIHGIALDNKTIADFMSRLENSKLYQDVNLKNIKQQIVNNLNLKNFDIGCKRVPLNKSKDKNDAGKKPGKI
ncbi:MAG: PilN domain-containing protein [Desulfobacterales bacterium]|jgi:type IV pilus assembly protein PilN